MALRRQAWLAAASALLLLAVVAAYWYFSPYLAIRKLQAAAEAGDVDTINEQVDFPRLRASIKGQLEAAMVGSLADTQDSPLAAAGAAVGRMMVGGVVEVLVQPRMLMYSIRTGLGRPRPSGAKSSPSPSATPEAPEAPAAGQRQPARWRAERVDADRVVFYPDDERTRDDSVGLVLDRYGFASWKLSGMRLHLPASTPGRSGG